MHPCNIAEDTDDNIAGGDLRNMGHIHERTRVPLQGDHMSHCVQGSYYNLEVGCNVHHNNMVVPKSNDRL